MEIVRLLAGDAGRAVVGTAAVGVLVAASPHHRRTAYELAQRYTRALLT